MNTAILDPAAYVVVAEVIHGPHAARILGEGLFCSIKCAEIGVRELARSIGEREEGVTFELECLGRLVGCAVTRGGRVWAIQALASHELSTLG
ncbi:hypothetical protein [Streptomyces sp. Isolate_219]|uniref:hypothetical protein n=1 Tax=Streptomyces sp. Isolate_219 TaxID=2950110 RepID=UPI0021CA441E|nr:hypothetical protein [Streptomyces sp. Isolate_219]MCR8573062.1 hypothetical protein [Streptomyces sp. Isolate_219]